MSGRRGYISDSETQKINQARRRFYYGKASTEEERKERLATFVRELYGCLNLQAPPVYRFDSPLAAMMALPEVMSQTHRKQYQASLLTDFQNVLGSAISQDREDLERDRSFGSVLIQAIRLPLEEQVSDIFKEAFARQMKEQCGLQGRLLREYMQRLGTPKMAGGDWWSTIANGGTWIWPYDLFAVVCDHPIRKEVDERGRLHREDDAAIEFADGYRIWCWHGVLVPKHVILFPEALKFEHVEKEQNLEIRRIIIERIGTGKYLKEAGAVLMDMDCLTMQGSAPRALMKDKLGNKWLVGTDGSTARVYTMAVPEGVNTCKEAHEMIAGFEESRLIAEA